MWITKFLLPICSKLFNNVGIEFNLNACYIAKTQHIFSKADIDLFLCCSRHLEKWEKEPENFENKIKITLGTWHAEQDEQAIKEVTAE